MAHKQSDGLTRLQKIALLLEAWLDFWPWPETWTGKLERLATLPGPAPFREIKCLDCEGAGKLRGGWACKRCRGAGSYAVDDYTGEAISTIRSGWTAIHTVNCSECGGWGRLSAFADQRPDKHAPLCERCDGTGRVVAHLPMQRSELERDELHGDRLLDALVTQRQRRELRTAYVQLRAAMALLASDQPGQHGLLCWVYVLGIQSPNTLLLGQRRCLVRAMLLLENLMPERIDVPKDILAAAERRRTAQRLAYGQGADQKQQAKRNAEIRALWASGTIRQNELARKFGMSHSRISQIVKAA